MCSTIASLPITERKPTVNESFFEPLLDLASRSRQARACQVVRDEPIRADRRATRARSLPERPRLSPRTWAKVSPAATLAKYFAALHSARRCAVLHNVNRGMLAPATAQLPDRLADIPELARYEVFAMDGHWHTAAAHTPGTTESNWPWVIHFYSRNLHPRSTGSWPPHRACTNTP